MKNEHYLKERINGECEEMKSHMEEKERLVLENGNERMELEVKYNDLKKENERINYRIFELSDENKEKENQLKKLKLK